LIEVRVAGKGKSKQGTLPTNCAAMPPDVPMKKLWAKNPHLRDTQVEIDVRFGALRLLVPS
jgi:hypothetical protein